MTSALRLLSIAFLFGVATLVAAQPSKAADNGDIEIEDNCSGANEAGPADGRGCLCDLGFFWDGIQCLRPGFSDLGRTIILGEVCGFFGFPDCGSGGHGGGGGNPPPPPEPERPECVISEEHDATCQDQADACLQESLLDQSNCGQPEARERCREGEFAGGFPYCQLLPSGMLRCTFAGPVPTLLVDPELFFSSCVDSWLEDRRLADTIEICEQAATQSYLRCLDTTLADCPADCYETVQNEPIPVLLSLLPGEAPQSTALPVEGWVATRIKSKGRTDDGSRAKTGASCFWRLLFREDAQTQADLYCADAGGAWVRLAEASAFAREGANELAEGSCGFLAKGDRFAGHATFEWKLERDASGALDSARVRALGGSVRGTLDGQLYAGDCKMSGKAIPADQVPRELLDMALLP